MVSIVVFCRRRRDAGDNLEAGCKWLRDAIANSLGIDDGDARVTWQYGQVETRGETGAVVTIEEVR